MGVKILSDICRIHLDIAKMLWKFCEISELINVLFGVAAVISLLNSNGVEWIR